MGHRFSRGAANGTLDVDPARTLVVGAILHNESAGPLYFWLENKATAPAAASTASVITPVLVPAASQVHWDPPQPVDGWTLGIAWGWSSDVDEYTEHGTADDLTTTLLFRAA